MKAQLPSVWFQKYTDAAIKRLFLWAIPVSVRPNQVTAIRIFLAPIVYLLLINGYSTSGLIVLIIAACTDFIDGTMARSRNQITQIGRLADPFADKLLIGATLLYFTSKYPILWVFVGVVGLELLALAGGAIMSFYFNKPAHSNFWGKTKMIIQCVGLVFILSGALLKNQFVRDTGLTLMFISLGFAAVSAYKQFQVRIVDYKGIESELVKQRKTARK